MSLKAFHLFFIVVSILTCLGFGAWGIHDYAVSRRGLHLAMGIASGFGGALLSYYLVKIVAKFKRLELRP